VRACFCTPDSSRGFWQAQERNLSGKVKSVSGSPIPNVRVSVKSLANGNAFSAITGEDGSYTLTNLPPGNYAVSASASGFAAVHTSVVVSADQDQVADLVLLSANEQAASSTVSGVVSSQSVREQADVEAANAVSKRLRLLLRKPQEENSVSRFVSRNEAACA
jgi:protocatechuate 3,4-dioxygenase beta subunit